MSSTSHPRPHDSRLPPRVRLALWMTGAFIGLSATLSLVLYSYQRSSLERELERGLAVRAAEIAATLDRSGPSADIGTDATGATAATDAMLERLALERAPAIFDSSLAVTLFDGDGRTLATSSRRAPTPSSAERSAALAGEANGAVFKIDPATNAAGGAARAVGLVMRRPDGETRILAVATNGDGVGRLLAHTTSVMLATGLIGVLAAAIAGWVVGGLAHAPLEELRRIAGSLLPERIEEEVEMRSLSPESAQLQRDLQDVRARLVDALHAQERFISNASHELKTPIAVLLTEAQTLRVTRLPPAARRFVQSVTDEMRRLGRTADSFLMLTRLRGGKQEVVADLHLVNDIVVDAVESCARMARQHSVALVTELADGDRELIVSGDAELLRVMLDNLIRNAVRFSPSEGRVLVGVREVHAECLITVRDNGPGLPEPLVERVFDRFSQGTDEATRGRGHGLGLSIAQGVAELHGGRISVRNHPGGGCEFSVCLRLAPRDARPPITGNGSSGGIEIDGNLMDGHHAAVRDGAHSPPAGSSPR